MKHFLLWSCIALAGCGSEEEGLAENQSRFQDRQTQTRFVEALMKEDIPFRVGEDGVVLYSQKYEEQVERVKRSILNDQHSSIHYDDKDVERSSTER